MGHLSLSLRLTLPWTAGFSSADPQVSSQGVVRASGLRTQCPRPKREVPRTGGENGAGPSRGQPAALGGSDSGRNTASTPTPASQLIHSQGRLSLSECHYGQPGVRCLLSISAHLATEARDSETPFIRSFNHSSP